MQKRSRAEAMGVYWATAGKAKWKFWSSCSKSLPPWLGVPQSNRRVGDCLEGHVFVPCRTLIAELAGPRGRVVGGDGFEDWCDDSVAHLKRPN
jgi:hypothetical protein